MISVNYVNNNKQEPLYLSPFLKVERELDDIIDGIEVAYQEYVNSLNMYELDATFLEKDAVDPKKKEAVDEKGKNFVSNLGASVINIFKKAIAFVTDLINKIKERFGGNKESFSKATAICNQNPKLKGYLTDEVKKAIDRGDMSITDLKALAELDKTYEEIVKLANKKDIDPDSLKGKWEAAKKKFESVDKTPIIKGALTITGIITAVGAANKVIKTSKVELNDALSNMLDNFVQSGKASELADKGTYTLLAYAGRYVAHQHIDTSNKANSIIVFLANLADSITKKVAPSKFEKDRRDLVKGAAQNKEMHQKDSNRSSDHSTNNDNGGTDYSDPRYYDRSDDKTRANEGWVTRKGSKAESDAADQKYNTYYKNGLNAKGRAKVDSEVKTK